MKKIMFGLAAAAAIGAFAIESANVVGYTTATSGADNNFVTVPFNAIGYNTAEGVVEQTAAVNNGIYTIATIVPFIMYLAMFLFLQFGYNLTKKYVQTVRETLDAANEE